jgi:hypothetical protein
VRSCHQTALTIPFIRNAKPGTALIAFHSKQMKQIDQAVEMLIVYLFIWVLM